MVLLENVRLILVRPQFSGNLGACARLAANFDLRDLLTVESFCSSSDSEAKKYATNAAREYLASFRSSPHILESIAGCHRAIGFTCRGGVVRSPNIDLAGIAAFLVAHQKTALVFGNEQTGLSAEELSYCTHVCQIPTSQIHNSLNLSHAVAVVLGRLYGEIVSRDSAGLPAPSITVDAFETLMSEWAVAFRSLPMEESEYVDRLHLRFKRILSRAGLSGEEAQFMSALAQKILKKSSKEEAHVRSDS